MVKFIDVDPDDIPNFRESHRGRVSYPILKSFLETGKVLVQLDRTGIQQSTQSLSSSLNAYIRNHNLPVKMFMRMGKIYLMRTDADDEGNVEAATVSDFDRPDKRPQVGVAPDDLRDQMDDIPGVDDDEVDERFQEEKGATTK
jgi:hypothetical protein